MRCATAPAPRDPAAICHRRGGGAAAAAARLRGAPPVRCEAAADLRAAAAATGTEALFQPLKLGGGAIELAHRVVMAPLTRCRALGGVPQPNMVEYYRQRSTPGGLIVSEATCISPTAHGYPCTPTLHQAEALAAWPAVTAAVHDAGGVFFHQIWHCGRASHPDYQPDGGPPLAPSPVAIDGPFQVFSPKTYQMYDYPVPREMSEADIRQVIADYGAAAAAARRVGADGVEIHGASGYLINQFLNARANRRTDAWGGSIENRCRFALEVVEAVIAAVGTPARVGLRLSPFGNYLQTPDPHTYALYSYLLTELSTMGLAYVHLVEPRDDELPSQVVQADVAPRPDTLAPFRQVYAGVLLAAGGYKGPSGAKAVQAGHADAVAFGRYFISCPDLVRRLALGAPLARYDRATFYGQDDKGFIDYPRLEETKEGRAFLGLA